MGATVDDGKWTRGHIRRSELNKEMICSCGASCSLIFDHTTNLYICSGCLLIEVLGLRREKEAAKQ